MQNLGRENMGRDFDFFYGTPTFNGLTVFVCRAECVESRGPLGTRLNDSCYANSSGNGPSLRALPLSMASRIPK